MGWTRISCADREALVAKHDLEPFASCTDLDAAYHSEPEVFTEWANRATGQPLLRDHRYPARYGADDLPFGKPDRKPCEHYRREP